MTDTPISSGLPRLDAFLADGYEAVKGMSSRFAAAIVGHILKRQTALGISGGIAEIGAFKGRFFIAMMMGAAPGEKGLAIDLFNWPSESTYDEFLANCALHGIPEADMVVWKADTRDMSVQDLREKLDGRVVRFIHIDGDHSDVCLTKDLALATAVLHENGIICLDDMLHPGYPTLVATVMRYLEKNPEMRVFAIIDREDIVAAPKFLICREAAVSLYEEDLMQSFAPFHYVLGADFINHWSVVLTPRPRLAVVD
ncbi:MAG: class I SAM-dependent methyltransferase [Proteobacteria bacterium]|nr:class I SAM-dependent methyltransferase [Pseudomonadota bacterium]